MNRTLWPLLTGFGIWALAFIVLYALQFFGCQGAWDPGLHRAALITVYGLFLAILAALLTIQLRRRPAPLSLPETGTTAAALAATAITFAPALFASACV